jgi:glycosyltransferase involved in cell wall biosynthesis
LKFLFILHYPPPIHGSAVVGRFIKESNFINSAFKCHYINLGTSATLEDIGRNSLGKTAIYFSLIWQVNKQLITFRPDFCYITPTSHGFGFYKDVPIIALAKLFRVKTIFHFHNKGVSARQDRFFDNFLYRFVFHNAKVILLSKLLYPDIKKYVPENRVYYCPNGIPDRKDKRQKAKDKSKKTEVEILFLSHLIEYKGVIVLIEACKLLREKNIDFHCTIAGGDGDLTRQEVEDTISRKGLSSFITVAGSLFGDKKMQSFMSSDIFVHPSFNDCLPLVLIEAMQHSLPIVSTFEGAIPDAVEDGITGFLVPQKNASALADKLETLIKDTELRLKMGQAGRNKYESEFTLEKFEQRMKEILEEVGSKK